MDKEKERERAIRLLASDESGRAFLEAEVVRNEAMITLCESAMLRAKNKIADGQKMVKKTAFADE